MDSITLKTTTVHICRGPEELGEECARAFVEIAKASIAEKGSCMVALSGGHTPLLMYQALVESYLKSVDWSKVQFFIGDERCVPDTSPDNNFGNAKKYFLSKVPHLPEENMHPFVGQDKDPEKSARDYEKTIKKVFGLSDGKFPRFDLIHLGMGPDGHCASLFPGTRALGEGKRLVVENHIEKLATDRVTFTFPTINHAKNVIFMVEGEEKSEVLSEILESDVMSYPVQHIKLENGKLQWFIDRSVARDLCSAPR